MSFPPYFSIKTMVQSWQDRVQSRSSTCLGQQGPDGTSQLSAGTGPQKDRTSGLGPGWDSVLEVPDRTSATLFLGDFLLINRDVMLLLRINYSNSTFDLNMNIRVVVYISNI